MKKDKLLNMRACGFWFSVLFFLSSCGGGLSLKKGEYIYKAAKVKTSYCKGVEKSPQLNAALKNSVRLPAANKQFLGFRPRVFFYGLFREGSYLQRKLGVKPILYTEDIAEKAIVVLQNRANNFGYFDASVSATVVKSNLKRTAGVQYQVCLIRQPLRIDSILYPPPTDDLSKILQKKIKDPILKPGDIYQLDNLRDERKRLALAAQKEGHYFFTPDDLFFKADTTGENNTVTLRLLIKPNTSPKSLTKYYISSVQVKMAESRSWQADSAAVRYNRDDGGCTTVTGPFLMLDTALLWQAVTLQCGNPISPAILKEVYQRINYLGVFSFIDIKPIPTADTSDQLLVHITLIPNKRYVADAGLSGLWTPSFQTGVEAQAGITRRNNSLKANTFRLSGTGALYNLQEFGQLQRSGVRYQEWSAQFDYTMPRFGFLYSNKNLRNYGFTKHVINGSFKSTSIDFPKEDTLVASGLSIQEIKSGWIMNWQNSQKPILKQSVQPALFSANWTRFRPSSLDSAIQLQISTDPQSEQLLFAPQVGVSTEYRLQYDNRLENKPHWANWFQTAVRFSASRFLLPQTTLEEYNEVYRLRLFLENEYRLYHKPDSRQMLVYRAKVRWGIPLSKSPFASFNIKDLYGTGGSNSIRAYPLRGVGPGTLAPGEGGQLLYGVINQLGNINIEANIEHRWFWTKSWETAVFLDAGNIWVSRPLPEQAEGKFQLKDFLSELAIGTGFGVRYHLDFLIVRFDLGIRLHTPWLPKGERWISPSLGNGDWWRNQTVFNFAFGHPF